MKAGMECTTSESRVSYSKIDGKSRNKKQSMRNVYVFVFELQAATT